MPRRTATAMGTSRRRRKIERVEDRENGQYGESDRSKSNRSDRRFPALRLRLKLRDRQTAVGLKELTLFPTAAKATITIRVCL